MTKMIFLLTAKPGMPRDAFIERYENQHVQVSMQLVPFYHEYRRSFLLPDSMVAVSHVGDAAARPEFDVVTELWFDDQAAIERMQNEMATTNAGELIAEDERDQFDRSKMLMIVADECITPADRLMPPPPGHSGEPAVKMMCTMRKPAGMSREAFIKRYETGHAEVALKVLTDEQGRCVFGQYRRTFPHPDGVTQIGDADTPYAYDFDVLTEIWFWTEADYQKFHQLSTVPEVAKALQDDEAEQFDMQYTVMFLADERISRPEECAAALEALEARKALA